jgi:peptide/nickel transport system substrate-binding protein
MEHRIVLRVVVLAAVLAFVSACTGAKQARSAKVVPERLLGGTLRVGVCCAVPRQMETPTFLDPQAPFVVANGHREFFRCCLSRTLLSYTGRPTASGGTVLHPDLAIELPEVSPDRLTWTFRLQPGIRYAPPMENMEITSPDIVRAIERTTTPSIGTEDYISVFEMIEGVRAFADGEAATIGGLETPDDLTLRVQLTEVTNDLGYRFALPATAPIPPSPSDASARFGVATGHDNGYGPFLVASGPYMIEGGSQLDPSAPPKEQEPVSGFVPGSSLTLVRNPSWSRETDGLRKAYVNRIEVEVIDRAEATRAVEAGSLDVLLDGPAPPEQVERFEADPTLRDRVFRERCNFVSFAPMRLSTPPFDDVHVRRAANYAFDVERAAKLAATFEWGPLGLLPFRETQHLAPDSTEANLLHDWDPYAFDPQKAKAEMALSKYDTDRDGRCDHPSCRGVLAIDTDFGPERRIDRVWEASFASIGIELDVRRLPFGRFLEMTADPESPAAINLGTFWEAEYPSPEPLLGSVFGSDGIGVLGGANFSLLGAMPDQLAAWGSPVTTVPSTEDKIAECRARTSAAEQQCWAELDQMLMLQVVPAIPFIVVEEVRVVSDRIRTFSLDQANGAVPALDQISVAPDA